MNLSEHLSSLGGAVVLWFLLLLTARLGFLSFRWFGHGTEAAADSGGPDTLLAATLGLLALLLGFTFSLALERHEDRWALVIAEATAVNTAWERTQALDEPGRTRVMAALKPYMAERVAWSYADDRNTLEASQARSEQWRRRLWSEVVQGLRTSPGINTSETLLEPFNIAFEAAKSRIARRYDRLPPHIINLLLFYTFTSAAMTGWRLGAIGHSYRVATGLMLLLLSLAIVAIVDLDTPRSGDIVVSQQPMTDVLLDMRRTVG